MKPQKPISSLSIESLFDRLWQQYTAVNPQAQRIHDLLARRGETVVNDHIALRTFNTEKLGIETLARVFRQLGYEQAGEYAFAEKKLDAIHLQHRDFPSRYPKVFISALRVQEFSPAFQAVVKKLDAQVTPAQVADDGFVASGRPWQISYDDYRLLKNESEYAAWLAALGYMANHFTVSLNHLLTFFDLADLNHFLKKNGFVLNNSGGEIKGTPAQRLEQSSTLASETQVQFGEERHRVPGCFYEFAKRYPQADGRLYQGFIAANADKIFESTDQAVALANGGREAVA